MAGLTHNQVYSNEPQPLMHWHKGLTEADGDLTLDDHNLDSQTFDMAHIDHSQRRESFASSASLVSPTHQTWPEYGYSADSAAHFPHDHNNSHAFQENGTQQYAQAGNPQYAHYAHHMPQWQHQPSLGPEPVHPNFGTFAPNTDVVKTETPYSSDNHASQMNAYGGLPVPMDSEYPRYPASAASPQWSTSSSDAVEKIPRSGQYQSSLFDTNPPQLRRDGVRKKNARFEIPEGRNLQTIDELINNTNPNNEEEIKELKQQKRLLRNRQAALDSRCRKKHHTEKLEEEKKHFLAHIDRLEDEIRHHQMSMQKWMEERQQWSQFIEGLNRDKEELVRQHTLETADLRRKNTYLSETVERLESAAISAQTSSNGASTGYPEFENLAMDGSPFEDFSFIENPIMEMEPKQEIPVLVQSKKENMIPADDTDKSAASGLLLMLLLCGAWVASRNSSTSTAIIPRMPDDVRQASSIVLENIYQDAGLQPQMGSQMKPSNAAMPQNGGSRTSINRQSATSPLASLHHDVTAPTQQQQREQIFSLSVDQYNHITTDDGFNGQQSPSQVPRRRSLGDTLAAMRAQKQGSASEVYTRSLLMDKVPADVVRDFARMVEESKRGEGQSERTRFPS